MSAELEQIVALSRALGDPALDLAILGEGNTSLRTGDGTMLVKASGASLVSVTAADFVELETAPLTALLDDPAADDAAVAQAFAPVEERTGRRPSVEAMLHAVCLELGGAHVVGHTHPVPVRRAPVLPARRGAGHRDALPRPDRGPGTPAALRALRRSGPRAGAPRPRRSRAHVARHGEPPKVIYLGNHGLFALGLTPEHVLQITAMAVKASRVLAGALAAGGASALAEAEADRIDARPDEHYRRAALARDGETSDA